MYLKSFKAKKIYGSFNFDINFNKTLNIIIGPNGVGKTTVLKIILAIFNLDYIFLSKLKFEEIDIIFTHEKYSDSVDLTLKNFSKLNEIVNFDVFSKILKINYKVTVRDNKLFEISYMEDSNDETVFLNLGKPMFLGLDRRFVFENNKSNDFVDAYLLNKFTSNDTDPLESIIELIKSHALANRKKSFRANTQLRNNLIRNLLEKNEEHLKPEILFNIYEASEKYEKVKTSLQSLSLEKDIHEIIKKRLQEYADLSQELKEILVLHETSVEDAEKKFEEFKKNIYGDLIDYHRLDNILILLEKYKLRSDEIFHKINLFQRLINPFFSDTNKSLFINFEGILKVKSNQVNHDISVLSSGERQLVILIGNLIFNKEMLKNRIFIIDEPELSLHISWQEIFIDTLLQGESDIQLILATHSPAIVNKYEKDLMTVNDSENNFLDLH
ncbi:AAA family ATPase [Acinetobacter baumannii]|nr:AAA family ATPase [Acinetobacter baumannii]EKV1717795.1 AAA family ATPase [Acinetobacter baumannii]MDO7472069.1 AAA family ATPase [Acinetobacter baumannii]MDO7506722.1 AAA family ATPase [Acinetobacter baumannii]MDV7657688.1 AAA family ATPase [Acinetobacter baumannii]